MNQTDAPQTDSRQTFSQSSEDDVSEGIKYFSKEMEYEWADQLENMDSKPAATVDPMKTSHLSNPLNKYDFLETLDLPVIAELNMMGQGTTWRIKSSIPTQTIVDRTDPIVQGDIMTNLVPDLNQMSLKSTSFPFHKTSPSTLMFAPFLEAFLTGNRHVRTSGIVGTCRADHSRIIYPRMNKDICVEMLWQLLSEVTLE